MTRQLKQSSRSGTATERATPPRPAPQTEAGSTNPAVTIKRILVPTDFSTSSRRALQFAEKLAEQFGAKIIITYVVEPMPMPDFAVFPLALEHDALLAKTKQHLERFARTYVQPGHIEKIMILTGKAYHEITEAALILKADLIVLGSHGHTGLKRAFLGSTAERVVRHAPCPVLTVREKEGEFAKT